VDFNGGRIAEIGRCSIAVYRRFTNDFTSNRCILLRSKGLASYICLKSLEMLKNENLNKKEIAQKLGKTKHNQR